MQSAATLPLGVSRQLRQGVVIPAHPLALNRNRKLDERRQRALSRYYIAAGAGGLAVGVDLTQPEIHEPKAGLLRPVLELAAEALNADEASRGPRLVRVAGVAGRTRHALAEARLAADLGYHAALLQVGAWRNTPLPKVLAHARAVAEVIPLFGIEGDRRLDASFWRGFLEIDNVAAVRVPPGGRYQTLEAARSLAESGRGRAIPLYAGSGDQIVQDLVTAFSFSQNGAARTVRIVGGLLDEWAVWTRRAETHLRECHRVAAKQQVPVSLSLLTLGAQFADASAAILDAANGFAGRVAGVHEVLRRQGLLEGCWFLDPRRRLSAGQAIEIDRAYSSYRHLNDDPFVAQHLSSWLG